MIQRTHSHHGIPKPAALFLGFILASVVTVSPGWGQDRPQTAEPLTEGAADLVDIKTINPHIVVDMKYATEGNFTKQRLYDANVCFLRRSTALELDSVQRNLEEQSLGLKVWDCYRPLAMQRTLWAALPDERYVGNPQKGSRHNRGSAVDVTLVDSQGVELQMPTGFDEFSARAHRDYRNLPQQVIQNRKLLETLMTKAGFIPLPQEWWHFDDRTWPNFGVLDVPLESLLNPATKTENP
jgi:zinc D-Ala-D-Ala dipeptidase